MKTYAFVDASNLFYGGKKSLGWNIDYRKLFDYLKEKYNVSKALYFGGVEIHDFPHDYLANSTVPINEVEQHLKNLLEKSEKLSEAKLLLLDRHLARIRFYKKLASFGYTLHLKPVKLYEEEDGGTRRKANVDVDMTFHLMKEKENFDRAVVLSGDGDFLPVLKYLKEHSKEVVVLARGPRTAREIRQFARGDFKDFVRLKHKVEFLGK